MANLLHIKGSRTQIYKTLPSNDIGNDGDIILSQIQGRGVYLCSKVNGKWHISSKMEELRKIEKTSTKDLTTNRLRVLDDLFIGRSTTKITKDEAKFSSSLKIKEAANAISDTSAYGQLWVKTATPNQLYFTTDAGDDIQLTSGTTAAFVGDITGITITTDSGGGSKAQQSEGRADFSILGSNGVGVTNSSETITVTAVPGEIDHDSLNNFVANEHIDWTSASAGTIDASNYTNTTYSVMASGNSYAAGLVAAGSGTHGSEFLRKDGTWVVPTNTTYSVGDGGLTTNDFTNDDHTKLNGIAAGAEVNVQADWNESSSGSDAFIQNKPSIPTNTDTTYSISCVDGDNSDEEKIRLTAGGSGSGTDDVVLEAGTGLSIARNSDKITFTNTVTDTNTNQLTTFDVDADSGTAETIAHGNTLQLTGGTGIDTTVSSTDTVTFALSSGAALSNLGGGSGTTFLKKDGTWATPTDTNTQNTTTLSFVDSSDDIILRNTTGGAGSGTDDIKFVAGSNITLTHTDADNITIASTDTNTTYTGGTNLTLDGTEFDVDDAFITNDADDTMAGALTIDKNSTATTSSTTRALYLDYDHTGITASGQSINNVGMDLNVNCSSVTHVGSHTSYGIKGSVTSSTTGTGTAYGMTMGVTGGDTNIGILTNVTDGGIDFKAKSTANADDYFTMATGTNGATTLTTVDDDATAANLLFDIDGDITLDAHGKNVYIAYNGTSIYDFDINNQSLKIMDSSDTGDYFEIAVANHGATTITTVDDDAANGNLTLDADGNLILDAGASNQIDFKLGGASYAKMSAQEFYLYNMLDTPDDYFKITMGNNGAAILSTNDDSGANGHLSIQPNGHVEFDNCGVGFDLVTPTFNDADTNVDFKTGNKQMVTLTDNIADLNLTFPATSGNFTLLLKQDGSGNHTMATDGWLAFESDGSAATVPAVKFPGGTAPTLTTAANHVDIVSFFWDADNQVCYGVVSLDFQD